MRFAVCVDPVKITPLMRLSATKAAPTFEPDPVTNWITPAGNPASRIHCIA